MSAIKNLLLRTAAPVFEAPKDNGASSVPVYSPEAFIEMEIGSLRTRFPAETVGYDDAGLFAVAMMPDEDLSDADWAELLQKHQPIAHDLDGEGLATLAQKFAARVSDATLAAMDTAVDGKEDWQGGPIIVRARLIADFGKEFDNFPVPGSKGVNNPDKYEKPVTDPNTGNTTMRKTSFVLEFTRGTKRGVEYMTEIAHLKRANNVDANKDGIPDAILEMTVEQRNNRIKYLDNRLQSMQQGYKKAFLLHHQTLRFAELAIRVDTTGNVNADPALNTRYKAGTVGASFIFDGEGDGFGEGDVINSPTPIMIWERAGYETGTGEPRPAKNVTKVSIGAFLKFNVATAMKNGSTFKALLATVARKPKAPKTAATADTKTETVDQYIARTVENYRFMVEMQQATDAKNLAKFYQVIKTDVAAAKAGKGGEFVVTLVELKNYLSDVCDEMQLEAAYADLQVKKSPLVMRKTA